MNMPTNKFQKSLTLIELIISLMIMSVVILATEAMHLTFTNMVQRNIYQSMLYQNTSNALERILNEIRESNSVKVSGTDLTLNKATLQSKYYLDTTEPNNALLCYQPDTNNPGSVEVVLRAVHSFDLESIKPICPGSDAYQAARITLQAKDPQGRVDTVTFLRSVAYCRIVKISQQVKLVGSDGLEKGYFTTIQSAIDAAVDGDIIQVSSNNNTPYMENLVIQDKSISLLGAYDTCWNRHLGDPSYETIIDGKGSQDAVRFQALGIPHNLEIEGFTIRNGLNGISLSSRTDLENGIFKINNNKISENLKDGIFISQLYAQKVEIINNAVMFNNTGGLSSGGISIINSATIGDLNINRFYICNNNISENSGYGICFDKTNGAFSIYNNNININTLSGVYLFQSGVDFSIKNNIINENNGSGVFNKEQTPSVLETSYNIISKNFNHGVYMDGDTGSHTWKILFNSITENNNCGANINKKGDKTSLTLFNNNISKNKSKGVYLKEESLIIYNNYFNNNNITKNESDGLYIDKLNSVTGMRNNNIIDNLGWGVYIDTNAGVSLRNFIIWGNNQQINILGSSAVVKYCDIQGQAGFQGQPSNIDKEPEFVDPDNNDYHLDPDKYSPGHCIDAGEGKDSLRPPAVGEETADMGAYGGANQSKYVGAYTTPDDPIFTTVYLREDKIGTY